MSSKGMKYNNDWSCYYSDHTRLKDWDYINQTSERDPRNAGNEWRIIQPAIEKKKPEVIYPFKSAPPKFWETMPEDMFADYIPPEEPY